jgi:hypothetical protein
MDAAEYPRPRAAGERIAAHGEATLVDRQAMADREPM